jgi:hypothetical protein
MPIAASVSGTVTRVAAGGTAAAGTLSVTGYWTNAATGTLAVDRTLFLAFYSRIRLTRPDLYINAELMPNLVGTVTLDWSLVDPVDYAEFTVSDKRASFLDPASISYGSQPVEIDLWAGPPGGVLKWPAFYGFMETATNSMPYRTRGDMKAVSLAALWANTQGCLNVPAMSGLTRGAVIAAFAASAGVTIVNANTLGGGIVTKALDLAGKTPFQLIQDYGEVEGWFARSTDDGSGLEIVSEDTILKGAPVFYFDESNTFDCPETTPDRPVTDWILSGTQMGPSDPSTIGQIVTTVQGAAYVAGVSLDSSTVTEITTDSGVEIKRVVSQYATVVTPGFSLLAASYQLVNRVTTESDWTPFVYVDANGVSREIPSSQLVKRVTTTETLGGVPECTSGGVPWVQGGSWSQDWAVFLMTGRVTETLVYDTSVGGDPCFGVQDTIVTESYYSPLDAFGIAYPDGSTRHDGYYIWQETERLDTRWNNNSDVNVIGTSAWSGSPTESYVTKYTTGTAAAPVGSSTTPQYSQQVIIAETDATAASGYVKNTSSATIDFAESVDELNQIAKRRIRRALSDQIAIPHKCVPFLRVGDHVSVTMHARGLVNVDAYVYSIERTCDVTNGAFEQVTTVNIPPSWI